MNANINVKGGACFTDCFLELSEKLKALLGSELVFQNEPMKTHTSFRTGGNARILVEPDSVLALVSTLTAIRKHNAPFYVMGNGTNLLVRDTGFDGVIVKLCEGLSLVRVDGNTITAGAGALLSRISKTALENSLAGLEFAEGIPGTLGGAVAMNAGAYGGEMKDVIKNITAVDYEGNIVTLDARELELAYRTSVLSKKSLICVSAVLELKGGDYSAINEKMNQNRASRTEKQPLDKPSAGSTFKRPEGYFAGKLISDSGLKGYKSGGAMVSEKHAGFVVSDGSATSEDVLAVIAHVQKTVFDKFGVMLETEVRVIG